MIETSIVGGEFGHFVLLNALKWRVNYVFIRVEGEEHERLVKVLKVRPLREGEDLRRATFLRAATEGEVKRMLLNMVKGVIWERGLRAKIVGGEFDVQRGVLSVECVVEPGDRDTKRGVKKLASTLAKLLHVRVEFEFVESHTYAAKVGWLGRCGLELCCHLWLKDLPSVTQDMARRQYLFAAPDKLTGACGRLLCCLAFEMPFYNLMASRVPKLNSVVETERGRGRVVEVNLIAGYYTVKYENGQKERFEIE